MWSSRLMQSLRKLGHEAVVLVDMPDTLPDGDVAIVNLGESRTPAKTLVARLHDSGIPVIAHAGHKEKELMELGKEAEVDVLATNSQLTFKLEQLLRQV